MLASDRLDHQPTEVASKVLRRAQVSKVCQVPTVSTGGRRKIVHCSHDWLYQMPIEHDSFAAICRCMNVCSQTAGQSYRYRARNKTFILDLILSGYPLLTIVLFVSEIDDKSVARPACSSKRQDQTRLGESEFGLDRASNRQGTEEKKTAF